MKCVERWSIGMVCYLPFVDESVPRRQSVPCLFSKHGSVTLFPMKHAFRTVSRNLMQCRPKCDICAMILAASMLAALIVLVYAICRRDFLSALGLCVYVSAAVLVLVACMVAIRRSRAARAKLALFLIMLGLSLYLLEIGCFAVFEDQLPQRNRFAAARRAGVDFDKRSKREVLLDLRASGVDAYPTFHPSMLVESDGLPGKSGQLYPLAGVSGARTVFMNEGGVYTIYESDERGFNNPPGIWAGRAIAVALIGDSYVQGAAVRRDESLAGRLRGLRPRVVFWAYHEHTDIPDLISESQSNFLLQYTNRTFVQKLDQRQEEIDEAIRANMAAYEAQRMRRIVRDRIKLYSVRSGLGWSHLLAEPLPSSPPALMRTILKEAHETVERWGGKIYFVYLPDWNRYANNVEHDQFAFRAEILEMVGAAGIPVIDVHTRIFARHADPLSLFPFRIYGHYTAEGYALIADLLAATLIAEGVEKRPSAKR